MHRAGWYIVRATIWLLQLIFIVVRWPLMVIGLFVLAGLLIYDLGSWLTLLDPASWERSAAEIGVRLLIGLPLAGVAVLLLHPIRGPLMLAMLPVRLVRRLLRRRHSTGESPSASPTGAGTAEEPPTAPPGRLYKPLSRRRFLIESAAVSAILADGLLFEPHLVEFTSVDIPVRNLPERFKGFTIAQLSDLHINPYTTVADLARIVPRVNELGADMIVITGDFVDFESHYAAPTVDVLRGLSAPEGVYSVLGNHDHYAGVDQVATALQRGDLGLLRNSHTVLRRGADKLYLLGVDDATHSRRYRNRKGFADLPKAMRGAGTDAPRLLLLHNPILAPTVVEAGVDVTLCGHTHAGQFRVPYLTGSLVRHVEYIDWGRYQWGDTQFYVNRGFGTVGPPIRFRARPEVTLIRLVPASV